jgi:hypothetical protein
MKSEGNIRQKLKQAKYRHRQKFMEKALKRKPCNCKFNRSLSNVPNPFPYRGWGFCSLYIDDPEEWQGLICDDRMDKTNQAPDCPKFEFVLDPDELKDAFKDKFDSFSIGEIAAEYPDVAALMWVLDESGGLGDLPEPECCTQDPELPDEREEKPRKFWARVRRSLGGR